MSDRVTKFLLIVMACGAISLITICGLKIFSSYNQTNMKSCTVMSKENITKVVDGNSQRDTRVYTSCGVFTANDSLVKGQFRSGDLYGSLRENHTYVLTYNGWRNGPLSMFPNITRAVEVN